MSVKIRVNSVSLHQITVALARRAATFIDRPNYQALAASAVAGGEDFRHTCRKMAVLRLGIGARIPLDAELG